MGDTIGGIMGPFVGLLAAALTFLAFMVQFQANEKITQQFKHERFENKFYEMLRIHVDNVNSIDIAQKHNGRKAFVRMFEELRFIYSELLEIDKIKEKVDAIKDEGKCRDEKLIKIAYHHMFFGVDYESKACNNPMGCEYKSISKILSKRLRCYQKKYLRFGRNKLSLKYIYFNRGRHVKTFEPDFYPFDGHVSKLAHLYRHLYHMIKFVARAEMLDWQQKYDYLKMLRGQLSNHEQAIMFFNIIWIDDEDAHNWWIDKKGKSEQSYLLDFAILKNLPFNLTNQLGPDPLLYFTEKMKKHKRWKGKKLKDSDLEDKKLEDKLKWLFEWNN